MYAIIATGGKQYKVSEGDVIRVEKIEAEKDAEITFDQVLAVGGDALKVGDDVKGASVKATVLEQGESPLSQEERTQAALHQRQNR